MHYEIVSHRQTREAGEAIRNTMTVGDLIEYLQGLDQDAPIIVSGYDGNLYNVIDAWGSIEEVDE